jgi:tRNA (Thr-GGU) A37 N-methylase
MPALLPIGLIHSPFTRKDQTPIQPCRSRAEGQVDDKPKGLFATRYPRRPNPIGLSVVRLVRREGRVLHVDGIDVLDDTPLLDIKPYVPRFDAFPEATLGWLKGRA